MIGFQGACLRVRITPFPLDPMAGATGYTRWRRPKTQKLNF